MTNLHDFEIVSYKVGLKANEIVVRTINKDLTTIVKKDLVFSDVLVHYFEDELSGSIILDINEYNIVQFIKDNSKLLEQRKNKCWPFDYDTIEQLIEKLMDEQYRYYVIFSSYGLNGWILSKDYNVIETN